MSFKHVAILTPAQHKQFEPNEGPEGGCEHPKCDRWASHICVYDRGPDKDFDGFEFRCSHHLEG